MGVVQRAPSAGFSQGHRLVVVTEEATRRELARLAGEDEYVGMGMRAVDLGGACPRRRRRARGELPRAYRKDDKLVDGEEITWPAPYWYVDSGSLFMLLQLAALDEGLGTGIYGVRARTWPS